jgi:phage-related protein
MTDPLVQSHETSIINKALSAFPPPLTTGLKLNADIILDQLVFNTIDLDGVAWVITDIEGWWNLPESSIRDIPRGWADGSYDVGGRWTNRLLTLKGSILPPGPELVPASRDKLLQAAALVYDGAWLRVYEEPQKAAFVRLSGKPQIQTVSPRGRIDFSIGLKAADPLKYGWNDSQAQGYQVVPLQCKNVALSRPGTVVINNEGNWDTNVIIEINGPIVGPATITNQTTGELIILIAPVPLDSTLEINTYRQEVALDGNTADARAMIDILANWILLAPGANTLEFIDTGAPNSTATLSVYFRPAWIG